MRVSSLPRFAACPSSALEAKYPYDPPSDPADTGTAVHEALASMVLGIEPDLDAIATKHDTDPEELGILFACGIQAWRAVREHFSHPQVEVTVEGRGLIGHADVLHSDGISMAVLDWKSGRVRHDYSSQLLGYASCAAEQYGLPVSGQVTVATAWLRFGEVDVRSYNQRDLDGFRERVAEAGANIGKRYGPGDACAFCPRQHECGARTTYIRASTAALVEASPGVVSAEHLAGLWTRSRALKGALEHYEKALKMTLSTMTAGTVPCGDGTTLELVAQEVDQIDAQMAWPLLVAEGYTQDELAKCVKMSKGAMTTIAGSKAAKRQKGKYIADLLGRLRAAGAINKQVRHTIRRGKAQS